MPAVTHSVTRARASPFEKPLSTGVKTEVCIREYRYRPSRWAALARSAYQIEPCRSLGSPLIKQGEAMKGFLIGLCALAGMLMLPTLVFADTVTNDVTSGGTDTFVAGEST